MLWIGLFLAVLPEVKAAEVVEETEKSIPLRSMDKLEIINSMGDVQVQGWAQDKVRIKIRKTIQSTTEEEKKSLLNAIDYRLETREGMIEISSQYGKDLSAEERKRVRDQIPSRVKLDILISAPSRLKTEIWTTQGDVSLKSWANSAEIRSKDGQVRVEGFKADRLSVLCEACGIQLRNVNSGVRCMGESGPMTLKQVQGPNIYLETVSGDVHLSHIQGSQLYVTKTGSIEGQHLEGRVGFLSDQAAIALVEVSGSINGKSRSGNLTASIRDWRPQEKSIIESGSGSIRLTLPRSFSAEIDLESPEGITETQFPIDQEPRFFAGSQKTEELKHHLKGIVREGGELLKVYSATGNVWLGWQN